MAEHAGDGRAVETGLIVADFDCHFRSAINVHPERKVGLIVNGKYPLLKFAALRA